MFKKNSVNEFSLKVLSECPLFFGLSKSELKAALKTSHIRDYSADEKVFSEGTVGLCFYIIAKGSVDIVSEASGDGGPKVLKSYKEGGYFSETHLFSEINHSVSCIAREVTKLIIFSKPDFEDFVKIKPRTANKLLLRFLEFMSEELDLLYKENKDLKLKMPEKTV